jgi:hypothetical protein
MACIERGAGHGQAIVAIETITIVGIRPRREVESPTQHSRERAGSCRKITLAPRTEITWRSTYLPLDASFVRADAALLTSPAMRRRGRHFLTRSLVIEVVAVQRAS